jgi:hypothetical protein
MICRMIRGGRNTRGGDRGIDAGVDLRLGIHRGLTLGDPHP